MSNNDERRAAPINTNEQTNGGYIPREELIERIKAALDEAPYINLLVACRSIEYK